MTTNVTKKENSNKMRAKVFEKVKRALTCVSTFFLTVMGQVNMAYATGGGTGGTTPTAEDKWDTVIGFIVPWITRLGGVVILIGAIEFGLAFKNDDAEGKTKGMRTIIAGCIVTAVGLSSDIFLA